MPSAWQAKNYQVRKVLATASLLLIMTPGMYEFVRRGDPPVVGITKLGGVTLEELKRPRKKLLEAELSTASPAVTTTPSPTTPPP